MWRCKKCGYEIIKTELQEFYNNLDKDGNIVNCFGKHTEHWYICLGCQEKIHDKKLEEIADWIE